MEIKDNKKFLEFLKEKWEGRSCPLCQVGNWSVQGKVFELREYHGGDFVLGRSPIIPIVPITCDNCGNTILVNAIISEAVESQKVDAKSKKKEEVKK